VTVRPRDGPVLQLRGSGRTIESLSHVIAPAGKKEFRMFAFPHLRAGDALKHANLTVVPLYADSSEGADYLLSDIALADGSAVVEEVTESGSVPQLSVVVTADKPVLFLEGEELRGAKQNRVLNTSVLVAAKSKSVLPVSCVEQGRWRYAGKHFGHSGTHASPKMRRVLKETVSRKARSGEGHSSDQGAVWGEVSRQMSSHKSESMTMAMSDTFDAYRDQLSDYRSNIECPEGAIGLAAIVGGTVVSVDVFDSPETCKKVWPRVLTGLTMDALETAPSEIEPDIGAALEQFRAGPWDAVRAAGVGEEYRSGTAGRTAHGSALAHGGKLVHGSMVFPEPEPAVVV